MKITGRALYLRWNGDDRNRWSALPVTSKGKWEALAEMYSGGLSRNVTKMVDERLDAVPLPPGHHDRDGEEERPMRRSGESIDVSDRIPPETSPSAAEWPGGTKVKSSGPALEVSDDQIFEEAKAFLQKAVDEALREPEIRELVTNVLLDRVSNYPEVMPEIHVPPVPIEEPGPTPMSDDTRAWLLHGLH
jgi:hypothetical protein